MGKHKGDIEIGRRMIEELERVFGSQCNAIKRLPVNRHAVDHWREGATPGGQMLARLHYFGGDVIYVLTGKRRHNNGC